MPRQNNVFGKWIEHSLWWPDYQTRFFKHNVITWPNHLHAQPTLTGEGVTLSADPKNAIQHLNYISIDEWTDKNQRYAKADAIERIKAGNNYSFADAIRLSVGEIIRRFFQAQGYKDGMHGMILSIFQSYYYFLVYAYYWEAKKYAQLETPESIRRFPRDWFTHALSEVLYWDAHHSPLKKIKEKFVRRLLA